MGTMRSLKELGIQRGDRVAILSENRPEWAIADFAIALMGAATVPIYATLTAEQISFLLYHSGARVAFVSSEAQWRKLQSVEAHTCVDTAILMDTPRRGWDVLAMEQLMASGPAGRDPELDAEARQLSPDDLATVIYTSGTTGVPKGVMLTHGNLASNISLSLEEFDLSAGGDLAVSFLPLSHITARHVDLAELYRGVTIAYCPLIEDVPRVVQQLQPTFFVAVPRLYEKIYNKVQRDALASPVKKRVFAWATGVGRAHIPEIMAGRRPSSLAWKLADKLVFHKVAKALGGQVRIFISGGAPLGVELANWYASIGLVVHEGYGLTETSPVIAVNSPHARKLGTVGIPLRNLELRVAEDGELLVRGPSVFGGYWNMPGETAGAFEDGWFKTGDIGNLDGEGFLSITDRKKDLVKTSGGKFIAPQPIENSLKANHLVAEAAVIGERRRFPSVVIAPAFAALEEWAQERGIAYGSQRELAADPQVQALYEEIVEQVNHNLARFERLKKVLVLGEELSIENGTLTPTLKLRRRNVEILYREQIEKLYADAAPADASQAS
jgi:long-chain acyl-CoA synthetase